MSRLIDAHALFANLDGMMAVSPTGYIHGDTVADMISDAPTVDAPVWIHVSERLPKECKIVLVTTYTKLGNELHLAIYVPDVFRWNHGYSAGAPKSAWIQFGGEGSVYAKYEIVDPVIAWMPLPKPYEEERT